MDAAFTNQIGDLDFPPAIPTADPASTHDFNAGPGWKWGYGLLLNTEDVPGMRRADSGAWAGLCNTHFWIDPTSGIAGVDLQQLPAVRPAGGHGDVRGLREGRSTPRAEAGPRRVRTAATAGSVRETAGP